MKYLVFISLLFVSSACVTPTPDSSVLSQKKSIPFKYVENSFIAVPVTINDSITTTFILDTGIGINLISKTLCEKIACDVSGKHTGKRMSGQELTVPMTRVKSLSMGKLRVANEPIGIFDMEQMMPGAEIGGFLSLGFFKNAAFTVNYRDQTITIEDAKSLEAIKSQGTVVPVKIDVDDNAVGVFLPLLLPNGEQVSAEVDTGSQALILDERFMKTLGISPNNAKVRRRDGQDETGHKFTRYFTKIDGNVSLPGAPKMGANSLDVMFQKIIYEGLVGHYFLSQFIVTYNLPGSEMIFRNREFCDC